MSTYSIILAAGKGTRMQSHLPKVLHRIGDLPMVEHLVSKLEQIKVDEIIVVIGYKGELVKKHLGTRVTYVEQHEQLGTAHAVIQASQLLKEKQGETLVLMGDTPLIRIATMENLIKYQRYSGCSGVLLSTLADDPTGYGRVIRDEQTGEVIGVVEEKDANPRQKQIREVNTGIYCFDNRSLFKALPNIQNNNAQQEYYLTDIIPELRKAGGSSIRPTFEAMATNDPTEVMGINDRRQLSEAEKVLNERKRVG